MIRNGRCSFFLNAMLQFFWQHFRTIRIFIFSELDFMVSGIVKCEEFKLYCMIFQEINN